MKKCLIVLAVCFLFASLSATGAVAVTDAESIKNNAESFVEISSDSEDVPGWAVGNFTGEWGLNVWGHDWFSIGPVNGYYGQGFIGSIKLGRFLITYTELDGENGTMFQGLFIGPYLLGVATDIQTDNTSAFVGLGSYNETNFRWRLMGMQGPTLFMRGAFNEF